MWDEISTYLYLLVAAMIKGNHSNCAQFAAVQRLDWLFGRLSNPQSAEGILDVLYCVLTESPEALNMINEGHIKSVISLLEKVGRDPKVLDVLSSLCGEGKGMAVRSSQVCGAKRVFSPIVQRFRIRSRNTCCQARTCCCRLRCAIKFRA